MHREDLESMLVELKEKAQWLQRYGNPGVLLKNLSPKLSLEDQKKLVALALISEDTSINNMGTYYLQELGQTNGEEFLRDPKIREFLETPTFSATKKKLQLEDGSLVIVIKANGNLDVAGCKLPEPMHKWLMEALLKRTKYVILDFAQVRYINDSLGALTAFVDKMREDGGHLLFVQVSKKMTALFDMLGLLGLYKIYGSEIDALAFLNDLNS